MSYTKIAASWGLVMLLIVCICVYRGIGSAAETRAMKAEVEQHMAGRYRMKVCIVGTGAYDQITVVRLDSASGQVQLLNARFGVITLKDN